MLSAAWLICKPPPRSVRPGQPTKAHRRTPILNRKSKLGRQLGRESVCPSSMGVEFDPQNPRVLVAFL